MRILLTSKFIGVDFDVGGSQEEDRHLQSVQDTMRLDRPRDKREGDTRVRNTCPFRGLAA